MLSAVVYEVLLFPHKPIHFYQKLLCLSTRQEYSKGPKICQPEPSQKTIDKIQKEIENASENVNAQKIIGNNQHQ